MNVIPNIIIGDPNASINADTLRTAYTKFNSHIHTPATSSNPLYYGLNLTEPITLTYLGLPVAPSNTLISALTPNSIVINKPTLNNNLIEGALLTQGDIEIYNITVNQYTNELLIVEKEGFISVQDYQKAKEEIIILNINNSLADEVTLTSILPPNFLAKYYIQQVTVTNIANTITFAQLVIFDMEDLIDEFNIPITNGKGSKTFDSVDLSENSLISNYGLDIKVATSEPSNINVAIKLTKF